MTRGIQRACALALLAPWVFAHPSWAQSQTPPGNLRDQPGVLPKKIYTRFSQFRLPFNLDDADRARLREVLLFVKAGDEPWQHKDSAAPTQAHFSFRAPRDGEYWFTTVVVDKGGNAVPADVTGQPPGLVVVVDTQRPDIEVREVPAAGTRRWFKCDVSDANPDPTTIRLEYQRPDGTWRPLAPIGQGHDTFAFAVEQEWPDDGEWTGKLRATAADRAGNTTTRDFTFKPRVAGALCYVENRVEKPKSSPLTALEQGAASQQPAAGQFTPPSPAAGGEGGVRADSGGKHLVNNKHVYLEYRIEQPGPSGIGKVEVWLTCDGGQTWAKLCDDPNRRSPVEFDLPGDGIFGVTLVVTNGNGVGGPAPIQGDSPDLWIEVDTSPPVVQFNSVRPGSGTDAGSLIFSYEARDNKALAAKPISFYWAGRPEGPWNPIARGQPNDGLFRWFVPRDAGREFYVRLEVVDQAGNIARVEFAEKIVLDQMRPRARVLGVTPGPPRATLPGGS
jgi:hypothetical protein